MQRIYVPYNSTYINAGRLMTTTTQDTTKQLANILTDKQQNLDGPCYLFSTQQLTSYREFMQSEADSGWYRQNSF